MIDFDLNVDQGFENVFFIVFIFSIDFFFIEIVYVLLFFVEDFF